MKISCDTARQQIPLLVAGVLQPDHESLLVSHLDQCGDCRDQMESGAGDELVWKQAAAVLGAAGDVATLGVDAQDGRSSNHEDSFQERDSVLLSYLSPTENPDSMGRIGSMEIVGVIGRGGAGIVYKAVDAALGRNVAIKLMDPSAKNPEAARQRFAREAKAMAAISHEHVVPVYGVSEHNGIPYFVMEYVAGGTLARRLETSGPLGVLETLRVGLQIAQGLAAAHRLGVVHRDVKPSNILLDPGVERVRVADFGLARAATDITQTESGALVGTPHYMSPEQVRCNEIDARSDLFSLGSVMYVTCSGFKAFDAESIYTVIQKITDEDPSPPSDYDPEIPDWFSGLVLRLLAKDPDDRFDDAESLCEVLEGEIAFLQQAGLTVPNRDWLPQDPAATRGRWKRFVLPALCLLVLVGFGFWQQAPSKNPSELKEENSVVAEVGSDTLNQPTQSIAGQSEKGLKSELTPLQSRWASDILEQSNHNPVAFGIGPRMLKELSEEDALRVAKHVWSRTSHQGIKTAVLKTFAFGRHAKIMQVLHLGMMDSDPYVNRYAGNYLKPLALQEFGEDLEGYQQWYAECGEKPLEDVFEVSYQKLAEDLRELDPVVGLKVLDEFNVDFGGSGRKTSYPQIKKAVAKTDLAETILGWLESDKLDKGQLYKVSQAVSHLSLTEEMATNRLIPLTDASQEPILRMSAGTALIATHPDIARETLLDVMHATVKDSSDPYSDIARLHVSIALRELNDPKSIAPLIAIMDSDNSKDVRSTIGSTIADLAKSTGVKHLSFADGTWWRKWWQENRSKFPAEIRQMEIEDLPKTEYGSTYRPREYDIDSHEGRLKIFREEFAKLDSGKSGLWSASTALAEAGDPKAIPFLIGAIEADNSYDTVYGVGYFGLGYGKLGTVTGVRYSSFHDGAWWRRWWEANKGRYAVDVQSIPIAKFSMTKNGKKHVPFPDDLDTHDGRVRYAAECLRKGESKLLGELAELFSNAGDTRGIPVLIGMLQSSEGKNGEAVRDIGRGLTRGGFGKLTKVSGSHDGLWWLAWWATHRKNFPEAAEMEIPTFEVAASSSENSNSDVAGVPAQNVLIDEDKNKRYFLIGDVAKRSAARKLLIVMPGGDGGPDFHPFVRRIFKNVLDDSWLIAQPVSVRWNEEQEIVWPTKNDTIEGAKFTTEEFVEMVIADVKRKAGIDPENIMTLTWSSSGPAAYAIAVSPNKSVTGSYIAMSVFRPEWYGSLEPAKGHKFFLDHSPEDTLCPYEHANLAEKRFKGVGATVNRVNYEGGHGWRGDVYGRLRQGLFWLAK